MKKKVIIFTTLFLISIFFSCSDFFNTDFSTTLNFAIKIPKYNDINRNINDSNLKLTIKLIKKDGSILDQMDKSVSYGETVTTSFDNVPTNVEFKISAEVLLSEKTIYKADSDFKKLKSGKNTFKLILEKVETLTNAETPTIDIQPISDVEIATDESVEQITKILNISATVYDGGDISFQWQEKGSDETWNDISEGVTSNAETNKSSLSVTLNKGESKTYRCIVTNTNESVNGEKTASITSNVATLAYLEGTLTSISASYEENAYQLFSGDFNYSNVKVKETYTGSDNSTETTITVTADSNRYIISKTDDSISAIGYVPYTVTYNNTDLTSQLRVPVKYKLPQEGLKITGTPNTEEWGTEENPELVAQFTGSATLSVGYAGDEGSLVPSLIYKTEDSERDDYDVMTSGVNVEWINGTATEEPSSVIVDNSTSGTKIYTATITPKTDQTWCIGENVSASYYVKVCPWEIELTDSSAVTVDIENLTGETSYTLSASNEAVADGTETITWVSSDTENFMISGSTLTTPAASTESDQTAEINAKVTIDETTVTLAKIEVTVKQGEAQTQYSDSKGITINSSTIEYTALVPVLEESTTITKTETSGAFTSGNVTLEPYAIGKYEVTQALYEAVMDSNPSSSKIGDNFPVEKVSWYDAVKFCNELTKKTMGEEYCAYTISDEEKDEEGNITSATVTVDSTKNGYRLPTEAEWEFAARGGDPSDTKNWNYTYAGSDTVDDVAWYLFSYDDEGYTIEVYDESLKANSLELKNMCGNVAEWTNTEIDDEGTTKIIVRGGHYESYENKCTVCNRENNVTKNYTDKKIGLRLCRTITE